MTININGTAYEYSRGGRAWQDGATGPQAVTQYGWGGEGAGGPPPTAGFQGVVIVRYAVI